MTVPNELLMELLELARAQPREIWAEDAIDLSIERVAAATGQYGQVMDAIAPILHEAAEEARNKFFDRAIELVMARK